MKSIFKLYIFKLVILSLAMIFISFGASATSVENLYKQCKPFQSNGFSYEGLSEKQKWDAVLCQKILNNIALRGTSNCYLLNAERKDGNINDRQFQKLTMLANSPAYGNSLVISFLKYAEANPNVWKTRIPVVSYWFLSKDFPCQLKE